MSQSMPARAVPLTMLISLGIIGVLGPFGTDVYLPAFPQMARDLGTTESEIRLTLSLYTLGMALGQLVLGALSDRLGRRRLMIAGTLTVAIAALSAANAEDLPFLLTACFAMGVGSSSGLVTGRAVISDKTEGREATRYFTLLQTVVSVGPIIGPLAGTALLAVGDWRLIFTSLSAFAVFAALAGIMFIPETLTQERQQSAHPLAMYRMMGSVLAQPQYVLFAATIWFGFGMLFSYISTSSFIFQSTLEAPTEIFAASFALNGLGLVLAGFVASRLARSFGPGRIIVSGLIAQLVGMAALAVITISENASLWTVGLALFVIVASMGFVFGPATSAAIEPVRFASGTALALLGSIQFASGGLAATLTVAVNPDPLLGFLLVGSAFTILALLAAALGARFMRTAHTR